MYKEYPLQVNTNWKYNSVIFVRNIVMTKEKRKIPDCFWCGAASSENRQTAGLMNAEEKREPRCRRFLTKLC